MHIIPATDLDSVRHLLRSAGLPTGDVGLNPQARFYLIELEGEAVALAGIECHGQEALLRSLVVDPEYRGRGLAAGLVRHIQHVATGQGASTLYLLTTSAADYFRRRGFHEVARDATPASIRQTRQFADLCPAEAVVLCRRLTPRTR
ncbi:arsenic resistance N-acetyltransferase ArsN2 [Sedimenticola hydrogenitrophicus]|uniref:arsenic resistance N-acetyltransferase ArsN2 n=1 Tax=Sedimenticola hydrogenitrophicus TaxID=2967975 RepID=UPI0021A7880B|nr:arsenic resistance N-acetyltransferase ArsN2 [Sedimenticola hydrogenitrophicus]